MSNKFISLINNKGRVEWVNVSHVVNIWMHNDSLVKIKLTNDCVVYTYEKMEDVISRLKDA